MRELSIWSDHHGTRGDLGVFHTAAELRDATTTDIVRGASTGAELLAILAEQPRESVDHLVIAGHGGTTWIIDDEYGVTTGAPRRQGQVSVIEVAEQVARIMRPGERYPLVSLAACMCSRSPTWWLRRFGTLGSDWGPRAYQPGGQASFSARLRDYCWYEAGPIRVRGHRAAGHATALALLAEHRGVAGTACETLFGRALGPVDVEPTLLVRRWWTRHITGRLAQRWLMGDDSVEESIRALWRDR